VEVSVLIPTFGRAHKLGRCLGRLARQTFDQGRFEVLVGVDGRPEASDADAGAAHALASHATGSMRLSVHEFEHAGPGATRNKLAKLARGRLILMLNDDVLPEPDLLELHVREHERLAGGGGGSGGGRVGFVLGAAPWVRPPTAEDTLFDRLVRETSMIFFYDRMEEALASGQVDRDHDWGFRHGWTLNLSVPRQAFDAAGGFDERLRFACYEDLEFTYRVCEATGAPVRYAPEAVVHHDHRIRPDDYLRREQMMGRAAWEFAMASPQCVMAVFGRDIRSREEVDYSRQFIARESAGVDRIRESFRAWADMSAEAVSGAHSRAVLRALYEQHLLLKRWTWRKGLLEGAGPPA
jgi:GT2 family glycosyltransferase